MFKSTYKYEVLYVFVNSSYFRRFWKWCSRRFRSILTEIFMQWRFEKKTWHAQPILVRLIPIFVKKKKLQVDVNQPPNYIMIGKKFGLFQNLKISTVPKISWKWFYPYIYLSRYFTDPHIVFLTQMKGTGWTLPWLLTARQGSSPP